MNWLTHFFTSSIGKKIIMSLTGLFLIIFLLVHLIGNLQLLYNDGGKAFNLYAKFMTTNPLIKLSSYLLYAGILLHAIQGMVLWSQNRKAKGRKYEVYNSTTTSFASRHMGWLGVIITAFLILHLVQFWAKMKFGTVDMITIDGMEVKDLYSVVLFTFKNPIYVVVYLISMLVIGNHLNHGFSSTFQSLGLNHKKYTPLIKKIGVAYSFIIPAAYAAIPLIMYFTK